MPRTSARRPSPTRLRRWKASGKALDKVLSVFFTVAGADSNPRRQELQRDFGPKLAAYSSELYGNKALFARVEAVWQARETLDLTAEQRAC